MVQRFDDQCEPLKTVVVIEEVAEDPTSPIRPPAV
jgi:hypothetical protein